MFRYNFFYLFFLVAKKIIYIMLLCMSCLNTGPRSHCSSISHRRVNLSRNERINPCYRARKYTRSCRRILMYYAVLPKTIMYLYANLCYFEDSVPDKKEFLSKKILSNSSIRFVKTFSSK